MSRDSVIQNYVGVIEKSKWLVIVIGGDSRLVHVRHAFGFIQRHGIPNYILTIVHRNVCVNIELVKDTLP